MIQEVQSQPVDDVIREHYHHQEQFRKSSISNYNFPSYEAINPPMTPPIDFHKIVNANKYKVPQIGSFVEFQKGNHMKVGVVIHNVMTRFDERFNHVLVLTNDNEILPVKPINIKFHLYKLISDVFVEYEKILHERHNQSQLDRQKLVSLVNRFLTDTAQCKRRILSSIDRVFSQLSEDKICPISLLDIIDAMELKESDVARITSSLYNQLVLLYAIHANLIDSCQWVVPNYVGDTSSNVFLWEHSNNYHSSSQYFANTQNVWLQIYRFTQQMSSVERIAETNSFIQKMKRLPKEEMNAYLNVFEGRHFRDILMVMKFAVVYPHSTIITELGKLDVFNNPPTASQIYRLLVELKVYDESTSISDIYLSLGLFGTPKQLSVTQVDQLNPKAPASFNIKDNFKHLRTNRSYYQDHVIYGLIDDEKDDGASFGVSIESLNSRKHLINIHIPDLITHISPDSNAFKSIFQNRTITQTLSHLHNNQEWGSLYLEKMIRDRKFHNYSTFKEKEEIWGDVIDMERGVNTKRRSISKATCLTISFEFNSYETNPFEAFDGKVSVSFDSVANVNIKNVNKKVLQDCLTGQLEPSFFKMLRRKQRPETNAHGQENILNKTDIHNINYIGGILKTFQKVRELEGAAIPRKELSLFKNTNLKTTHIETKNGLKADIVKPDSLSTTPQADFMHKEARIFSGCLASMICYQNQIPLLMRSQDLDSYEFENDSVLVQHENIMIPVYESQKYAHSIMAKDESGYISSNAKIISNNYLAPKHTTVYNERNVPLGLSMGYAEIFDIFRSGEALFNQFQLLSHVQSDYQRTILKKHSYLEFVEKFNHLKSRGYNLNGPFPERKLNLLINSSNANDLRTVWQYRMYKFWILNWLYQKHLDNTLPEDNKYEGIATHIEQFGSHRICKAYCSQLGIEVDVLGSLDQDIKIGTTLVCVGILYLDPISGFCMLDGRGDIRI